MTGVFGVVLGQILLMFLYLIIGYVQNPERQEPGGVQKWQICTAK